MFKELINKQRFLVRAYKYLHVYDKDEIRYLKHNLKPGDVAFDIGAHKGAYAYWMRRAISKSGHLLAIEPQPILYKYLQKMVKYGGYKNVTLKDYAISETDKEGKITVPGQKGSISQGARIDEFNIVRDKHKEDIHTIEVKFRSIDSIIKESGLRPNLIKIDVEGHEFSVLKGMKNTLESIRPKIILECEERHITGFSVFDVFDILLEKNYDGYYFQKGVKKELSTFNIARDQTNHLRENQKPHSDYANNFIFEPK